MGLRHLTCIFFLFLSAAAQADNVDTERFTQAAQAHRQGHYRQAAALWQELAEKGVRDAQYNLGLMYRYADGVPEDLAAALRWYKRAAEQGDIQAQYEVGLMYQEGIGVAADQTEAHRWFTMNRLHHYHHVAHNPQLAQWRQQAAKLIWQDEMRTSLARSRQDGQQVLAELQERLQRSNAPVTQTAALAIVPLKP